MKTTKKLLAVVLAAIMLLGVIPLNVFADDVIIAPQGVWVAGTKVDAEEETYWVSDGAGGITDVGASAENYNVKYTPAPVPEEVEGEKAAEVEPATLTLNNVTLSKAFEYKLASYSNTVSAVIFTGNKLAVTITLKGSNVFDAEAEYGFNLGADSTITGRGNLNISNVTYGIYGAAIIDGGAKVYIEADYVFGRDESKVKKGTLEGIGAKGISDSSYSFEIGLHDPRKCTVKLNDEATADGATRWRGDDEPMDMDDGTAIRVRDKTVDTKGFKYIKVSYYPEPIATFIMLLLRTVDLTIVFGKALFVRMPLQIYNVIKIIIENIGEIIDSYY